MSEEKFPVSSALKVIEGITIRKSDRWWSAVVLLDSFGRRQICLYLWQKRQDKWKRQHKFIVRSKDDWELIKKSTEKLLAKL